MWSFSPLPPPPSPAAESGFLSGEVGGGGAALFLLPPPPAAVSAGLEESADSGIGAMGLCDVIVTSSLVSTASVEASVECFLRASYSL